MYYLTLFYLTKRSDSITGEVIDSFVKLPFVGELDSFFENKRKISVKGEGTKVITVFTQLLYKDQFEKFRNE